MLTETCHTVFCFCTFCTVTIQPLWIYKDRSTIEGLPAKRAYIAFLADFRFFLQDQANFWQTDLC